MPKDFWYKTVINLISNSAILISVYSTLQVKSRGIFRRATGDDTAALRALSSTTEQLLDEVIRITVSTVCR
jgi:hypothetical protein